MAATRPAIEQLSQRHLAEISAAVLRSESTGPPPVFRWPGRRPPSLVRAFIALLDADKPEIGVEAALGRAAALEEARRHAAGKTLYDPFAGSGVIPVEAARLGYYAVGQDVNPYAVAIARANAELCTGECRLRASCIKEALVRAWRRSSPLWCRGDECIVHMLLARCPPCRAPVWVSSRRSREGPRRLLVLRSDLSLEWVEPGERLGSREPSIEVPPDLPREHPDYVVYAVEIYRGGRRRWVSLARDPGWRRWVEETAATARGIAEDIPGAPIPFMEETRRLYRRGVRSTKELFSWRQLASLAAFINEAGDCRELAVLLAASAAPSNSLLAMYYQPLAKINPGLIVKSYWLPRNPAVLNPFAHRGLPAPPGLSSGLLGRGTLVSVAQRYARRCGSDCAIPPSVLLGDSTRVTPVSSAHHVVTDPPYPGMHTYKDMSLLYAQMALVAGARGGLDWEEIDTRDPGGYRGLMRSALRTATSILAEGGYLVMFLSAHKLEYIELLAETVSIPPLLGAGLRRVYPVVGEAPGRLGRGLNKLVFVAVYRKGAPSLPDAAEPLAWAGSVLSVAPLGEDEKEYSERVAGTLRELVTTLYSPAPGK